MDYSQTIQDVRNQIHKELVLEATVKNTVRGNESEGVLQLIPEFKFGCDRYTPNSEPTIEVLTVESIDCETGELNGIDSKMNEIRIYYNDMTVEQMVQLHEVVVLTKKYKFILYDTSVGKGLHSHI
jgi:hypothetical protein